MDCAKQVPGIAQKSVLVLEELRVLLPNFPVCEKSTGKFLTNANRGGGGRRFVPFS
jgi:hypothetical protein